MNAILVYAIVGLICLCFSWYSLMAIGSIGFYLAVVAFAFGLASLVSSRRELKRDPSCIEARVGRAVGAFVTVVTPVTMAVIVYGFYLANL